MAASEPVFVTWAGSQANRSSIALAEAVRALVRATEPQPAIPASELLVVAAHLQAAGYGLTEALQQLAVCLSRSAEPGLFWAASDDQPDQAADTAVAVEDGVESLTAASEHALMWAQFAEKTHQQLGREADAVQDRLIAYYHRDDRRRLVDEELMDDPDWVTVDEAAEIVGVKPGTIQSSVWRRDYGHGLVGHRTKKHGLLRFRLDDVIALRNQRDAAA